MSRFRRSHLRILQWWSHGCRAAIHLGDQPADSWPDGADRKISGRGRKISSAIFGTAGPACLMPSELVELPKLRFRFYLQSIFRPWKMTHNLLLLLVGAGRFERPTPCAQGRCATRLRYAPTFVALLILDHFPNFRYLSCLPRTLAKPWQDPSS